MPKNIKVSVSIPTTLLDIVDKRVESNYHYSTRSAYIVAAVIEKLEKEKFEKNRWKDL